MKRIRIDDCYVKIEPSRMYRWSSNPILEKKKECLEIKELIEDHISLRQHHIDIVTKTTVVCEYCDDNWEIDDFGCPVCCNRAIEEWKKHRALVIVKIAKE